MSDPESPAVYVPPAAVLGLSQVPASGAPREDFPGAGCAVPGPAGRQDEGGLFPARITGALFRWQGRYEATIELLIHLLNG